MLTGLERAQAIELLKRAEGHVKAAIVMHRRNATLEEAQALLAQAGGNLRSVLENS
jgi:N-acetylmuramic acid 6-phosphate (MurNAc-6-P) etherase